MWLFFSLCVTCVWLATSPGRRPHLDGWTVSDVIIVPLEKGCIIYQKIYHCTKTCNTFHMQLYAYRNLTNANPNADRHPTGKHDLGVLQLLERTVHWAWLFCHRKKKSFKCIISEHVPYCNNIDIAIFNIYIAYHAFPKSCSPTLQWLLTHPYISCYIWLIWQ